MEMDPNALSLVAPGGQFVHTEKNFRPSGSMKPYSRELGSGLSFSVPTRRALRDRSSSHVIIVSETSRDCIRLGGYFVV
jgi:hypothetical protein